MRTATRTHASIVDGKSRVARVTVGACSLEERKRAPSVPEYLLNGRVPPRLAQEDEDYIRAAEAAAEDCWSRSARREEVAVVLKIELPLESLNLKTGCRQIKF
jgi:hypothetical protein